MAEVVLAVIALLGLGFFTTRLASLARVPHSVFLVLVGLLGALALHYGRVTLPQATWQQFPEVVLYILLPPLIFDSAYHLNAEELRRDLWSVVGLSTVALLISCAIVGWGLHALLGLPASAALLFGALISATDPVAVVALFREVGAPRRLSTIIEGESLINDGTAIVLFRVVPLLTATAAAGRSPVLTGIGQFFLVALGGVVVGLGFVLLFSLLLRTTSQSGSAQLGLTVVAAYASFIVADRYCGVSGVISTMTVGLYLGNRARLEFGREALHSIHALWEFLALCANTLVFLAVGLRAEPTTWRQAVGLLAPVLLIVLAARAISVVATLLPLNLSRRVERVGWAYQAVLVWGGLRGGLALALVLILPDSYAHKALLLSLASAVVLSSLLLNALTTAPLLRLLRLDQLGAAEQAFLSGSLARAMERFFGALAQAGQAGSLSPALVAELQERALARLRPAGPQADAGGPFEFQQLLLAEQGYYDRQLEDGVLSQRAYLALQQLVNQRLRAYQHAGLEALRGLRFEVVLQDDVVQRLFIPQRAEVRRTFEFEALLHLELGLRAAGAALAGGPKLAEVHAGWAAAARRRLDDFFKSYPHLGLAVQSRFIASTFLASTTRALAELHGQKLISEAVYAQAGARLEQAHAELRQDAERRMRPALSELLAGVPLLRGLPPHARALVEAQGVRQTYPAGAVLFREGEVGSSLFVLLSGVLEVQGSLVEGQDRPRLFAGASFGEVSLLRGALRNVTVVALGDSEVMELRFGLFADLLKIVPSLRAEVEALSAARPAGAPPPGSPAELLGRVPLFAGFPSEVLEALLQRGARREVRPGQALFARGEAGSTLFVVLRGQLACADPAAPGGQRLLGAGEATGELCLMFGAPRTSEAKAQGPLEVLEISREAFEEVTLHHPLLRVKAQEEVQRQLTSR